MIIGVTGSRDWASREIIALAFDEAYADFGKSGVPNVVIEGGASGADLLCKAEGLSRGWHVAQVPAIWGYYGKQKAGHVRNSAMVYLGVNADAWLAFVNPCGREGCPKPRPHDSHGSTQCMNAARMAAIEVRDYDMKGRR